MGEQDQEHEPQESLAERVENLAHIVQSSSVGEIELTEDGTEIIIKRQPGIAASFPDQPAQNAQVEAKASYNLPETEDRSAAIVAPLTGIFYASPSPGSPPFVQVGDVIQLEQEIALIEAMKVFNEIQADVAGRVLQINADNGGIVKKGDVLFRVEPL